MLSQYNKILKSFLQYNKILKIFLPYRCSLTMWVCVLLPTVHSSRRRGLPTIACSKCPISTTHPPQCLHQSTAPRPLLLARTWARRCGTCARASCTIRRYMCPQSATSDVAPRCTFPSSFSVLSSPKLTHARSSFSMAFPPSRKPRYASPALFTAACGSTQQPPAAPAFRRGQYPSARLAPRQGCRNADRDLQCMYALPCAWSPWVDAMLS